MRPSHITIKLTLLAFLFATINLHAQDLASAATSRATIVEYAVKERPVLVELLTTAGLLPVLSGDAPYTLFAPPEAALKALKGQPADKVKLVMSGHIVKGKYTEKDLKDGAKLETLNGQNITICRKTNTLVNGVAITKADTELKNGVVHDLSSTLTY
ncbi:fasciclin domain-containing protein [Pontibacter sp. Tf4]|uniref:fasciclin domain-containing protein n=1 Tax=Pontibacter sp. Tf4 TaxID=2761620 RepID=UPI0016277AEE|nr:fasciclin domain-containing protein [Pontibacter sp. Tf4]MBB6609561.1 fasciclin domain-containing protein [Pontibacter sp. Tf4]